LANALNTSLQRISHDHESIADTAATVRLNQSLLETEIARLAVGRTSARHILEVERDLLIAKINALATTVRYSQSVIELEVLEGSYLEKRGLEYKPALVAGRIQALMTDERGKQLLNNAWVK
jgi:outer membrane protein TolC